MAAKNKSLPGHKWQTQKEKVEVDGARFFLYVCRKCQARTLNGHPLEPPFDTDCGKA